MSTVATDPAATRRRSLALPQASAGLTVGILLLILVVLVALFGVAISGHQPNAIDGDAALSGPSADHWLGADNFGRDEFARVASAYRISLVVAVGSVALAVLIGVPLGLAAGHFGSTVDNVIMRPLDLLMAFPVVLLAVTVTAIAGTGIGVLLLAIGIVYVPIIARTMRAAALATSAQTYVEAARSRGASPWRLLTRHVLPNSAGPVIVQASLLTGLAIILEAALSFVGLGVRPPTASLGLMLADGRDFMANSVWVVAAPGLALVVLVLAFTLIGDGLNDRLDPRGRARIR
jgi:peptide/nickel transport system permease protein